MPQYNAMPDTNTTQISDIGKNTFHPNLIN